MSTDPAFIRARAKVLQAALMMHHEAALAIEAEIRVLRNVECPHASTHFSKPSEAYVCDNCGKVLGGSAKK